MMTYFEVGEFLKKQANPDGGNFVTVNLNNAFETVQSLGYFFRYKKHDWLAIFLPLILNARRFILKKVKIILEKVLSLK
jgi:hypothetical protein